MCTHISVSIVDSIELSKLTLILQTSLFPSLESMLSFYVSKQTADLHVKYEVLRPWQDQELDTYIVKPCFQLSIYSI